MLRWPPRGPATSGGEARALVQLRACAAPHAVVARRCARSARRSPGALGAAGRTTSMRPLTDARSAPSVTDPIAYSTAQLPASLANHVPRRRANRTERRARKLTWHAKAAQRKKAPPKTYSLRPRCAALCPPAPAPACATLPAPRRRQRSQPRASTPTADSAAMAAPLTQRQARASARCHSAPRDATPDLASACTFGLLAAHMRPHTQTVAKFSFFAVAIGVLPILIQFRGLEGALRPRSCVRGAFAPRTLHRPRGVRG